MKRVGRFLLITAMAMGATACDVALPLLAVGATAVGTSGVIVAAGMAADGDEQGSTSSSDGKIEMYKRVVHTPLLPTPKVTKQPSWTTGHTSI